MQAFAEFFGAVGVWAGVVSTVIIWLHARRTKQFDAIQQTSRWELKQAREDLTRVVHNAQLEVEKARDEQREMHEKIAEDSNRSYQALVVMINNVSRRIDDLMRDLLRNNRGAQG